MHEGEGALAHPLLGAVPEHPLDGRARVAHRALGVEYGDDVGGVLHQRPEPRPAPAQGLLGPLTIRDVADDQHDPGTAVRPERLEAHLHVDRPPALVEHHRFPTLLGLFLAPQAPAEPLGGVAPVLGRQELQGGRHGLQLPRVVAADLAEGPVRVNDAPILQEDEPLAHLALGPEQGLVELLLSAELPLGLLALGDVAEGDHHAAHGGLVEQVVADPLDATPRAVGVPQAQVERRLHARLVVSSSVEGPDTTRVLGVHEGEGVLADQALGVVTQDAADRRAEVGDRAVLVHDHDDVRRVPDEGADTFLPFLQSPLGLLAPAQRPAELRTAQGHFLPRRALAREGAEQLQPSDHRPGEGPQQDDVVLAELPGPGVEEAQGADRVAVGGGQGEAGVKSCAVVDAEVLVPEPPVREEIAHHERRLRLHHVPAHAALARVPARLGQLLGQLTRPRPEVLGVSGDEVRHAQPSPEGLARGVDQILQDAVGPGPGGPEVLQRRQARRLSAVMAGDGSRGPVHVPRLPSPGRPVPARRGGRRPERPAVPPPPRSRTWREGEHVRKFERPPPALGHHRVGAFAEPRRRGKGGLTLLLSAARPPPRLRRETRGLCAPASRRVCHFRGAAGSAFPL